MPGVSILEYSDTLSAVTEYLTCPSARAAVVVINADVKAAIIGYQTDFDNLKFTADYWLPGVNTGTGIPDGSTRVYGLTFSAGVDAAARLGQTCHKNISKRIFCTWRVRETSRTYWHPSLMRRMSQQKPHGKYANIEDLCEGIGELE